MAPWIHQHSVVAGEILVGARDEAAWRRWYDRRIPPSGRVGRVITPSHATWLRASRMVARLSEEGRIRPEQIRAGFFNDCLLAASAREGGFVLVTHDRTDFELLPELEPGLEAVPPFPAA
jgi:predicted nucleic acid-binding protein